MLESEVETEGKLTVVETRLRENPSIGAVRVYTSRWVSMEYEEKLWKAPPSALVNFSVVPKISVQAQEELDGFAEAIFEDFRQWQWPAFLWLGRNVPFMTFGIEDLFIQVDFYPSGRLPQ